LKTQQSGSISKPISIDERFFRGIEQIAVEIKTIGIKTIADANKLSVEQVLQIEAGNTPKDIGKSAESKRYSADLRKEIDAQERIRIAERVSKDVVDCTSFKFNLSYNNGYTFQTTAIDQLTNILETEADRPEEMVISAGTYGTLTFRLTVGSRYGRTASYTLDGSRKDVEQISGMVRNLLKASEPENSWLHQPWLAHALLGLVVVLFVFAYWFVIARLPLAKDTKAGLFTLFIIPGLVGAGAGSIPVKRLKRAFPPCQFEFGPEKRRRGTYRSVLWATVSVVAIPLFIAWFFAR
jgi:hypothetical protein